MDTYYSYLLNNFFVNYQYLAEINYSFTLSIHHIFSIDFILILLPNLTNIIPINFLVLSLLVEFTLPSLIDFHILINQLIQIQWFRTDIKALFPNLVITMVHISPAINQLELLHLQFIVFDMFIQIKKTML